MKAALKRIFREKAYSRLSDDEQKTEYPTVKKENALYVAQKNLNIEKRNEVPQRSKGKY